MFNPDGLLASHADAVARILDPGQGFIDLSHFTAVPGGYTIKESYTSLVGGVVQPFSVTFDLMPLTRKMSQSFLDFHTPASQPGCVSPLNIALHRSGLLPLERIR
jgi:hypothetical protein